MRFLVDAQPPSALARRLAAEGHEANHVRDIGLTNGSDSMFWHHAAETGAVIIIKDADFAHRRSRSVIGPAVVCIRLPNAARSELLLWFALVLPEKHAALECGDDLVEVFRT